ncbi:MAG: hypothetical protein WC413_00955 [Candidatus Nanoarchaeia archaeon]
MKSIIKSLVGLAGMVAMLSCSQPSNLPKTSLPKTPTEEKHCGKFVAYYPGGFFQYERIETEHCLIASSPGYLLDKNCPNIVAYYKPGDREISIKCNENLPEGHDVMEYERNNK